MSFRVFAGAPLRLVLDALHPLRGRVERSWLESVRDERPLARVAADPTAHRCVPAVASVLARAGVLDVLSLSDRGLAEVTLAWSGERARAIASVLGAIGERCRREGVRCFLCKGAALHGLLYADPAARPSSDVDLFAPASDVERLVALLGEVGLSPDDGSAARVDAFVRDGRREPTIVDLLFSSPSSPVAVEVKADPIGLGPPIARLDALCDGGSSSPVYAGLLLPSAETMVLQQTFSIARRPRADLLAHAELAGVLCARRAEFDADRLLALVDGEGLDGVLRAVLAQTESLFAGSVPARLLRRGARPAGFTPARLRRAALAPAPREDRWTQWGLWAAHAIGSRRPGRTLRWLLARVFPPEPLLSAAIDDDRGPRGLRPARRLVRALRRSSR